MNRDSTTPMPEPDISEQRIGIHCEWFLTPTGFDLYEVVLVVASADTCEASAGGLRSTVYHAQLPAVEVPVVLRDVSGSIGLLAPSASQAMAGRATGFERLVADATIWHLHDCSIVLPRVTVLITGPMLPKLRGRLLYRPLPPQVKVVAVTFQSEWLQRLDVEADGEALRPHDAAGVVLSPMIPSARQDSPTRVWICGSAGDQYHCEVVAPIGSDGVLAEWYEEAETMLRVTFMPDLLVAVSAGSQQGRMWQLPPVLANAARHGRDVLAREQKFVQLRDDVRPFLSSPSLLTMKKELERRVQEVFPEFRVSRSSVPGARPSRMAASKGTALRDVWSDEAAYKAINARQPREPWSSTGNA